MVRTLFTLFFFVALQGSHPPKVGTISVNSEFDTEIVYRYAFSVFPQGEPLPDGAVSCLVSELKATGLFIDINVKLEQTENGQYTNILITPTWHPQIDNFLIDEIIFENFEGIDTEKLRLKLRQKGFGPGIPIMKMDYSFTDLGKMIEKAVKEIYKSDLQVKKKIAGMSLDKPQFTIALIAPEKVQITISLQYKTLCR